MTERADSELLRLISDFPSLVENIRQDDIRKTPKEFNRERLEKESFSISEFSKTINPPKKKSNTSLKILFAHFSPFQYELEGLGLPTYATKMLPNCQIDFTYDKGGISAPCFSIGEKEVKRKILEESYDLVIARSSVLINMMRREVDRKCLEKSGKKINIKTMSYQPNYRFADYYFEEEDMCPPADPMYLSESSAFMSKNIKENIISVSGTLWYVKNQLRMFQDLNPDVLKDYKVVILGPERDVSYVKNIIDVCDKKGLDYYLVGSVNSRLANHIKSLSKVSIIPMDMRVFGQPKGYPRTLGESIGSRCLTLCNKPVTIPDFYEKTARVYNEDTPGDLNDQLEKCLKESSSKDFIKFHNWGEKSFEDVCYETIFKALEKG